MPIELQDFKFVNDRISKSLQYNWNEFDTMINGYLDDQKLKKLNFEYSIRDINNNIHQTEDDEKELLIKGRTLETRLQLENNQLSRLNKEIIQFQAEESNLPLELKNKTEARQKNERESEILRKYIQEKREQEKKMYLKFKEEETNRETLGFFIEPKGEKNLQLTFTKIHPLDPERQHILVIGIEDQRYTVIECFPAIPQEKMNQMVKNVNATNDFTHFVKSVRSSFCALCKLN